VKKLQIKKKFKKSRHNSTNNCRIWKHLEIHRVVNFIFLHSLDNQKKVLIEKSKTNFLFFFNQNNTPYIVKLSVLLSFFSKKRNSIWWCFNCIDFTPIQKKKRKAILLKSGLSIKKEGLMCSSIANEFLFWLVDVCTSCIKIHKSFIFASFLQHSTFMAHTKTWLSKK